MYISLQLKGIDGGQLLQSILHFFNVNRFSSWASWGCAVSFTMYITYPTFCDLTRFENLVVSPFYFSNEN